MDDKTQLIVNDLFKEINGLVKFPFPSVCRHYVALGILGLIEKHGFSIPNGLAKSLSDGSNGDEESLKILNKVL